MRIEIQDADAEALLRHLDAAARWHAQNLAQGGLQSLDQAYYELSTLKAWRYKLQKAAFEQSEGEKKAPGSNPGR